MVSHAGGAAHEVHIYLPQLCQSTQPGTNTITAVTCVRHQLHFEQSVSTEGANAKQILLFCFA